MENLFQGHNTRNRRVKRVAARPKILSVRENESGPTKDADFDLGSDIPEPLPATKPPGFIEYSP